MSAFKITSKPICSGSLLEGLVHPRAGARVSFEGVVRNHHQGQAVNHLEYEGFAQMVESEGNRILNEALIRFCLTDASAVHRVGRLEVGEVAVWVGALAEHRQEAFLACRWIMDEIKNRLPIWKKESFVHGKVEWVGSETSGQNDLGEAAYYQRQMRLPQIGNEGQDRLARARVLVVGAGGLGCPALQYLAGAGVGKLSICDADTISISNLHRQILYTVQDVGQVKSAVAAERLRSLNPHISVQALEGFASPQNLKSWLPEHQLVLDCTDNFDTRFMLHDACWAAGVPLVQAAVHQFEGIVQTFSPGSKGGCYRCLWPERPAEGCVGNCVDAGILGAAVGSIGVQQAMEALKWILQLPGTLENHSLLLDILSGESRRIKRTQNPECSCVTGSLPAENPFLERILHPDEQLRDLLTRAVLVDLREANEREPEVISHPQILHRPRSEWTDIPADYEKRPLILCCAAGVRARHCLEMLEFPEDVYVWPKSMKELLAFSQTA